METKRGLHLFAPIIRRADEPPFFLHLDSFKPEKHTKRQETQHDCLPSLLDDGDKEIEKVYGEEKKYFVLGRIEQPSKNKNLLYRHDKPNEPTNSGPLSFVLFESPFTSVSTVGRNHPSLVSFSTNLRILPSNDLGTKQF